MVVRRLADDGVAWSAVLDTYDLVQLDSKCFDWVSDDCLLIGGYQRAVSVALSEESVVRMPWTCNRQKHDFVFCVDVCQDASMVACGTHSSWVYVMDLRSQRSVCEHGIHQSYTVSHVAFSPDSRYLLSSALLSRKPLLVRDVQMWGTVFERQVDAIGRVDCARFCFTSRPDVVVMSRHLDSVVHV